MKPKIEFACFHTLILRKLYVQVFIINVHKTVRKKYMQKDKIQSYVIVIDEHLTRYIFKERLDQQS